MRFVSKLFSLFSLFFLTFVPFGDFSAKFELRVEKATKELSVCLFEVSRRRRSGRECTFGETRTLDGFARLHLTFRWTDSFSLLLDNSTLVWEENAPPDNRWHRRQRDDVTLHYRIACDLNYHGNDCATFCRPRDDVFGHYSCSASGKKECSSGWKGPNCDSPKCKEKCNETHGFCSEANQCKCRHGWKGDLCDECQEYPGCLHGYCVKAFECQCHRNWGGILCDQDLNYCGTHAPCLNSGQCVNVAPNHYRCECKPGFAGLNCQTVVDFCATEPCLSGGSCVGNGSHFQCLCVDGFEGERCEVERNECLSKPCLNGECHDLRNDFKCECDKGFFGKHCDEDVDECLHKPCIHSKQCFNTLGSYRCKCLPGFEGVNCESEVDDCAHVHCRNGGQCLDLFQDFRCICKHGFGGQFCERVAEDLCEDDSQHFFRFEDNNCSKICFCLRSRVTCSECLQNSAKVKECAEAETDLVFSRTQSDVCQTLYSVHKLLTEEDFCCSQDTPTSVSLRMTSSMRQRIRAFPQLLSISERKRSLFSFLTFALVSVSALLMTFFAIFHFWRRRRRSRDSTQISEFHCIRNNLKSDSNSSKSFFCK